jgi:hypothetical protein
MRTAIVLASLVVGVNASAQATKTPAKPDSAKAPASQAAGAKTAVKTDAKAPAPAPGAKTGAPAAGTKTDTKVADTKQGTKAPAGGTKAPAPAAQAPVVQGPPVIMREAFSYAVDSRRDPFVSLLTSDELRPTVEDLRLTGVLFDEGGRNSIATMRDLTTDAMYRVRTGQILGRMRVALIKRTVVIFSIEEFGANRQDSLVLGDTTKARAK